MKKPREFWINANNWQSVDDKPFNCDEIIRLIEYDAYATFKAELITARGLIEGKICEEEAWLKRIERLLESSSL